MPGAAEASDMAGSRAAGGTGFFVPAYHPGMYLRLIPSSTVVAVLLLSLACDAVDRPSAPATGGSTTEPLARSRINGEQITGTVQRVFDGDSLIIRDDAGRTMEVRLATVDAPERRQPFSDVSRRHLSRLLRDRRVAVEIRDVDRYDRRVGIVRVEDRDAGLEMIRAGMAWHYRAYAADQSPAERAAYEAAEKAARAAGNGLWRDPEPVAPWEFRRSLRRPGQ